ncbi:hypothetical protein [uncultured Bacteroides sp.]|uniref:hypothetical protein n=1 Tax=uncultured Bacteroides sp. TaxID=162156 RepID=UPI002AABA891|nr:hypothetical protein [uncultured Bacteroides sp.]
MKKRIFIIMLFALLSDALVSKDISKIKLIYGWEGTYLPVSAYCTPESFYSTFGDGLNFLTTYDDIFIKSISNLHEELLPMDNDSIKEIDPRIMIIIYYNDSLPNDTIYLGEFNGIYRDGKVLKDNKDLLNIVKKKIGWNSEIEGK